MRGWPVMPHVIWREDLWWQQYREGTIGIVLDAADGNVIQGNFIGTNATGDAVASALPGSSGVVAGSDSNTVGGTTPAARNLVSGNSSGVQLAGSGNQVQNNYIGTDRSGIAPLSNNRGL